jgi:hypothetical protein
MASIFSTSLSSNGLCVPMPALLTSAVMLASSRRTFHAGQIGLVAQIGGEHLDRAAGLVRNLCGQRLQLVLVAGDEDEIVATGGKAVGVDGADAGGGAGDEGGALVSGCGGHGSDPSVWYERLRSRHSPYGRDHACPI